MKKSNKSISKEGKTEFSGKQIIDEFFPELKLMVGA